AALSKSGVFIVAAKRTPFGAFGGALKDHSATDLAETAARAALEASGAPKDAIGSVVFGNVIQSHRDTAMLSRHVAVRLGLPISTPAFNVNRLCGSGFQSVVSATNEILLGDSEVSIAGGSESMSGTPYAVWGVRFGTKFGTDYELTDLLWHGLIDKQIKTPMGVTAENLAEKFQLTRKECDEFAVVSQDRWQKANADGAFKAEIVPMQVKGKKGPTEFAVDEHPRAATVETMAKLPPVFKKNGVVHAGNASGICDGAAALVLASEAALKRHSLKPLARLVGYHFVGCDPSIMGIGPVPAVQGLLAKTGRSLAQVDLVEVNEAFAPQYLAVERQLSLDRAITNVNGGAIALGHPVGASGSRIMAHLAHELHRRDKKLAIGSACIGGGQGIAIMIERC
ncbi:hypothetical protein BOX15_Mlig030250g3, partial [Macrostomum lignano]